MDTYTKLHEALEDCKLMDIRSGHIEADATLKMIAFSAAEGILSLKEVISLVRLYDSIEKY